MQFNKMSQGSKNSPAIFQKAMQIILKEMIGKICIVYIDEILVFGKDIEEHDKNLLKVLDRLNVYGLEENLEKRGVKR